MLPVEKVAPRSAYRLGSRFSHNSKLMVDVYGRTPDNDLLVGFDFYVNESLSEKDAQQAEEVRDTFRANVNAYLLSTGQATPIE